MYLSGYLLEWICWGTVVTVWVIGALYSRLKVPVERTPRSFTILWLLVGIAGAFVGKFTYRWWGFLTFRTPWTEALGSALLIASTVFTLWSRAALGRMWALDADIKEGHRLRTDGPYRITRHPIYTGLLGMLLGSSIRNGFGWMLFALIGVFLVFLSKLRAEEALLIETFGDEYRDYQRRTPCLLPGVRSFGR